MRNQFVETLNPNYLEKKHDMRLYGKNSMLYYII